MGFIRKNKGSLVRLDSLEYVGEKGYLFWDIETGCSRLSDGITPGGISIANCYGSGGPGPGLINWGDIGGTLSNQTDLQTELNLKANQTDLTALDIRVSDNALAITALQTDKEDVLGDPTVDGYILSSLIDGTRSWIPDATGTDATWGNITGILSDQIDLQTALDAKENDLGDPLTSGQVLSSATDGTRTWINTGSGTVIPPVQTLPPTDSEIVDSVDSTVNLGIKWIYTLQNTDGDVFTAEILANHQSGTQVTHTRSNIIGTNIQHTANVVLDSINDLLQLVITNLSPNAFVVNIVRIKITS